MALLRGELGERGKFTSRRQFAQALGVIQQRYDKWESRGSFPGRAVLAACLAKLESVKERGLDPVALATWADLGPDDQPPLLGPETPNDADDDTPEQGPEDEADVLRFGELVDQLGSIAQARVVEAATSGKKIPEPFMELVRVALDVRELSLKTSGPRDHRVPGAAAAA